MADFNARTVPQHVSITCSMGATFDLIVTLRAAVAELEGVPESIREIHDALKDAYVGDLPPVDDGHNEGGTFVTH